MTGELISTVEPVSLLLLFNTTRTLSGPYGHGTGVATRTGAADRNLDGGMADTACSYTGCYRRGLGKGLPFPLHCYVTQKYR